MDETDPQQNSWPALLETKLFRPEWRNRLVSRDRLVARLTRNDGAKLTLISAQAGFGKSTLLGEWLARDSDAASSTGWVSLDESDSDPARFWTYAITAISRVLPGVGKRSIALLSGQNTSTDDTLVASLINEITAGLTSNNARKNLTLVLDDYHLVESDSVHSGIGYLLDHMPPGMQLVIASRAEPPLQLARLRARGELNELRADDLRFTLDEIVEFLRKSIGIELNEKDVRSLEQRTEGWAAGLQLAALSMEDRSDITGFVDAFAGHDRYIIDYLVEEVLRRQPEEVQEFLLLTSVLDRMNGSLCEAITGSGGGQAALEQLERQNLFVVALDDSRNWYRYHHLFADVVRARLARERPDAVAGLHVRAAEWFEQQGMVADAVEQAKAAQDHESVARLVVDRFDEFEKHGRHTSVARWLRSLPQGMIDERPRLALMLAAVSLGTDDNNSASRSLSANAEKVIGQIEKEGLGPEGDINGTVIGPDGIDALKGEVIALRLFHSSRTLSRDEVGRLVEQALELVPRSRRGIRSMLSMAHAGLRMHYDDPESTLKGLQQVIKEAHEDGNTGLLETALSFQGNIHVLFGDLAQARRSYEQALDAVKQTPYESEDRGCMPHTRMAELLLETGDLEGALVHVREALEIAEGLPTRSPVLFSRGTAARVLAAAGMMQEALEQLALVHEFVLGSTDDRFDSYVVTLELDFHHGSSDLESAAAVVRRRSLSSDIDATKENAEELTAFARYLVANGDFRAAEKVASNVLQVVREAGNVRQQVYTLVVLALAREGTGRRATALESLGRATALGEPGKFSRPFTLGGEKLAELIADLKDLTARSPGPKECGSRSYLNHLQRDFGIAGKPVRPEAIETLSEPLTVRETEVLQLVAGGMRNQEIADQLFISLATVKRHIANAYNKLQVTHRTEAVARAAELNLL